MPEALPLKTSDHRAGKPAVSIPIALRLPRVATRHPTQEFAVVYDKVCERELMRIEQEWCDAEGQHGEPEVDQMRYPYRQRSKE